MRLIDSHAHLTDPRLSPEAATIAARAASAGVEHVVSIGTSVEDSRAAVALASILPAVSASVGIHPHSADQADDAAMHEIEELAAAPGVVAIGETGLDYHYEHAPRAAQRKAFLDHLQLAQKLGLPVVVHSRAADADLTAVLLEAGQGTRGVLHCFSGGAGLMDAALDLGWYVSFAGMITFSKYADAELLRAVPADRILVETDSPYLAPAPHRGKRNEPAFVELVARRAAELRGEEPSAFAAATTANARRFYALDDA